MNAIGIEARGLERRHILGPTCKGRPQLKDHFLIDSDGVVWWANIECGNDGLSGIGKFPSREGILAAARNLASWSVMI